MIDDRLYFFEFDSKDNLYDRQLTINCCSLLNGKVWQKTSILTRGYIIYRWTIAIIFFVLFVKSICDVSKSVTDFGKYFIYLTHWGFMLCTIQAILAASLVTLKNSQLKSIKMEAEKYDVLNRPSTMLQIYWVMYTMAVVCAFGITIIFWTRVYIPSYHKLSMMVFVLHGLNTVLMLLDVMIVAHPLKFMHFLWTFGFVLIYLFFTYIYFLAGGTNSKNNSFIYHSLNWNKPKQALTFCISSLLFGFVIHSCMWMLSAVVRRFSGASVSLPTEITRNNQNERERVHRNPIVVVNVAVAS